MCVCLCVEEAGARRGKGGPASKHSSSKHPTATYVAVECLKLLDAVTEGHNLSGAERLTTQQQTGRVDTTHGWWCEVGKGGGDDDECRCATAVLCCGQQV